MSNVASLLAEYGVEGVSSIGPLGNRPGAYIAWTDSSGTYRTFFFDLVDEHWSHPASIPKHPVEQGFAVTDDIHPQPRKVTLKIFISAEPIDSNAWSDSTLGPGDPVSLPSPPALPPSSKVLSFNTWDNELLAKALANSVGGAVGNAVGGGIGAAVLGGLAGGLFPGHPVPNLVPVTPALPAPSPGGSFTPIVRTFAEPGDFVRATIELLNTLWLSGQTVDCWGSKEACCGPPGIGGMGIAGWDYDRNFANGTGCAGELVLEEIRIVSTTTVPAPKPAFPDSTGLVSKGNVQPYDMFAEEQALEAADALSPFAQGEAAGEQDAQVLLQ